MDVLMNSFVIVCTIFLLCLNLSKANDCKSNNPCQGSSDSRCFCPNDIRRTVKCVEGRWRALPCDIPTTPEPKCFLVLPIANTQIKYSERKVFPYPIGTTAEYVCVGETNPYNNRYRKHYKRVCRGYFWDPEELPVNMCSCEPINVANQKKLIYDHQPTIVNQYVLYPFYTTATFQCNNASFSGKATCKNTGKWEWTGGEPQKCEQKRTRLPHVKVDISKTATSKSPINHTEQRTIVIVSGTTGAILGALIVLVVIVSCQRRIHYHRVRRARIRHRQDQDAFAAFITYHRDARLMLPSYDEAINQQEQGQPPSFEEALGHYEEPTLSLAHTPTTSENPPSVSTESPTSSASPGSETHSVPENDSDRTATVAASTSENSRFFRSLRMLFGGRAFRPDAIYCRFVPEEDGSESQARREERGLENNAAEDELTEVLAQAGLY